jgi:hypothetical protein
VGSGANPVLRVANEVPLQSTTSRKSKQQAALLSGEKVLTLLRTNNDGVEHLMEMADRKK